MVASSGSLGTTHERTQTRYQAEGPNSESFGYDGRGRLTLASSGGVTSTLEYDSLSRLILVCWRAGASHARQSLRTLATS